MGRLVPREYLFFSLATGTAKKQNPPWACLNQPCNRYRPVISRHAGRARPSAIHERGSILPLFAVMPFAVPKDTALAVE